MAVDLMWFNASAPRLRLPKGRTLVRLWNLFHRDSTEGRYWGVGLLQVGHRHLFFVGDSGQGVRFCALFFGTTL